jgi:cell division cycle 14
MNFSSVMRFITILDEKLTEFPEKSLVYCVDHSARNITNGAFLLGTYMLFQMRLSPEAIWSTFEDIMDHLTGFRDATYTEPDFQLSLLDCWRGLAKADAIGWIAQYDLDEYIHYDSPLEGDLHHLIPDKLIAFRGPKSLPPGQDYADHEGSRSFSPSFYVEPFEEMGVTAVVRLNEPEYDAEEFTSRGVAVLDLQFDDCAPPPPEVLSAFLDLVRDAPGAVAVHCKAGLGRTGTLAAAHLMAAHGFTAREAMGWLRVVRPGSVLGEQQHFLCELERLGWQAPAADHLSLPLLQQPLLPIPEHAELPCYDAVAAASAAAAAAAASAASVRSHGGSGPALREAAAAAVAAALVRPDRVQAKRQQAATTAASPPSTEG